MSLFKRKKKFVRVVPSGDILHETTRYEKGKVYRVDIALARYFERNGWLEGSISAPPPAALEIDDGKIGQSGGF